MAREKGNAKHRSTYRQSMINKFGTEEAWKEHMAMIGSKGGLNSENRPFRDNPKLARKAGLISGEKKRELRLLKKLENSKN